MASANRVDIVSRVLFTLGLFFLSMALMLVNAMLIPEDKTPKDFVNDIVGDCGRDLAVAVGRFYAGGAQCYGGDQAPRNEYNEYKNLCARESATSWLGRRHLTHDFLVDFDERFVDALGYSCDEWADLDCSGRNITLTAEYSEDQLEAVQRNCPACCKLYQLPKPTSPEWLQDVEDNPYRPEANCPSEIDPDDDRAIFTLEDFDDEEAKTCSKLVIEERAFDIATGFLEFHIGVLLLYVYTLHMIVKAMKKAGPRQACGKLLFVFCLLVETILVARFVFWVEDFAPLDGSDWKWERLGGDDYLNKMLNYNAPFNDIMWQTLLWALGVRFVGFFFCMGMVICDARTPEDQEGTQIASANKTDAELRTERRIRAAHDVYVFTFIVLMTSCGMVTLYFFWQSEADDVEFSYIAGTACENVQNKTNPEFALQPFVDRECVSDFITMRDRATVRSLFSVYATVLIFYMLTIAEAMDFIEEISEKWFPWTRLYIAVIAILEVVVFIAKVLSYFEMDPKKNLVHNNPNMDFYNELLTQTIVFRTVAMTGVIALYSAARCEGDPKEDTDGEKKFVTKNKKGDAAVTATPATPAVVLNAA